MYTRRQALEGSSVAAELVSHFKALVGDAARLQIVMQLAENPDGLTVSELCVLVSRAQPTLSHHMRILSTAELVSVSGDRDRRHRVYKLTDQAVKMVDQMRALVVRVPRTRTSSS